MAFWEDVLLVVRWYSSILKSLMILMRQERDFLTVRRLRKFVARMKSALVTGDVENPAPWLPFTFTRAFTSGLLPRVLRVFYACIYACFLNVLLRVLFIRAFVLALVYYSFSTILIF